MADAIDAFLDGMDFDEKIADEIIELEEMEQKIAEARQAKQSVCIVKEEPSFQIHFQSDSILLAWSSQTGEIDQNAFQKQIDLDLYLRFQGLKICTSKDRVRVIKELHADEESSTDLLSVAEEACSFQESLRIIDRYRMRAAGKETIWSMI